ncbi:hypothetical protein [Sphingomonas immobilis]|uniref:Uncharacterized protein n=1 Tax=Sphingomonas immobilis TaxID=3063997 RepID=A0ABT8ZUH2_9SPHN|nr:hypothetical protein [Sphingomonas sp. CA1-15]MDO7841228.1 hypothetical protein [Sphingomonas sp. CA1-15]
MSMFGNNTRPMGSLSATLLARKGQARPAMRPQGFGAFGHPPVGEDDLGWNDMGADVPAPVAVVPPVLVQREALKEEFEAPVETVVEPVAEVAPEPVFEAPAPVIEVARPVISPEMAATIGHGARAKNPRSAFTLRLDRERHLRLRLASAVQGVSAQALVTEALDAFLQSIPEVEELVRQLPARAAR